MRCKTAQQRLEAYLGGELTGKELTRLKRHLASCTECSRALERARGLHKALSRKRTPPVPEGFHARLMGRARQRGEGRGWADKILRPFGLKPAMSAGLRAAAAAAVIVALGVGMLIGRDMWRGRQSPPAQSARAEGADPVEVYRLDSLAEGSESSLTGAYVSLVSAGGE